MSDISGPPGQNSSQPISRVADSTAQIGRDPRQDSPNTDRQNAENQRDTNQSQSSSNVRDPAVTISASTAGLQVGDRIERPVDRLDSEGRPIIVTDAATFALRPDAGLRPGDDVDLRIVTTGRQVEAEIVRQNEARIDPPIRVDLIVVAVNSRSTADRIPPPEETNIPQIETTRVTSTESSLQTTTNLEAQTFQISGTSATGQPVIVTDQAVFEIASNLRLETGDEIRIQLEANTVSAGQSTAFIFERNDTVLNPPIEITLTQITQNNQTLQVPNTADEAIEFAQSQVTNNIIPTITVTEADRTLPPAIDPRNLGNSPAIANTETVNATEVRSAAAPRTPSTVSSVPATEAVAPQSNIVPQNVSAPAITDIASQIDQNPNFVAPISPSPSIGSAKNISSPPPPLSPIEAFTFAGRPQLVRVLDVAVSQVNPAIVAQVTGFTPLTVDETRSLSLPINAFANIDDELARLQTSRGALILPLEAARNLVGETIELVPETPSASAPTTVSIAENAPSPSPNAISIDNNQITTGIGQTGVGAYLQNLPIYSAELQPVTDSAPLDVSVAILSQSSVETAAWQAAEDEITNAPRQSTGAIAELATIANLNDNSGRPNESFASTITEFGPTVIQSVIAQTPNDPSLFANQSVTINTGLGSLVLTASTGLVPKSGDIAIILPNTDSDATAAAERALNAANNIASAQAINSAAPLDTVALNGWPALFSATSILGGPQIGTAPNNLSARTASGGGQFSNSILFFLTTAKNGNPSAWIGSENETQLARNNSNLLETLKSDISRLFANSNEASGEWRPISIPLDTRMPDIPFITLLVRNEPEDNKNGKNPRQGNPDTQRFLLEISFKNLGAIQLDGFIKEKRFDLTFRSHADLPEGLSGELRNLFNSALDANGFTGALSFEEKSQFPVNVQAVLSETSSNHGQGQVS